MKPITLRCSIYLIYFSVQKYCEYGTCESWGLKIQPEFRSSLVGNRTVNIKSTSGDVDLTTSFNNKQLYSSVQHTQFYSVATCFGRTGQSSGPENSV